MLLKGDIASWGDGELVLSKAAVVKYGELRFKHSHRKGLTWGDKATTCSPSMGAGSRAYNRCGFPLCWPVSLANQ